MHICTYMYDMYIYIIYCIYTYTCIDIIYISAQRDRRAERKTRSVERQTRERCKCAERQTDAQRDRRAVTKGVYIHMYIICNI